VRGRKGEGEKEGWRDREMERWSEGEKGRGGGKEHGIVGKNEI